ncbi:MAG: hypothetical protein FJY76_04070 [Candidatus Aenigmarchaeota archaeon]|nr:hypothetical protein [Candidatus Aenigmarchaeota archaeon]
MDRYQHIMDVMGSHRGLNLRLLAGEVAALRRVPVSEASEMVAHYLKHRWPVGLNGEFVDAIEQEFDAETAKFRGVYRGPEYDFAQHLGVRNFAIRIAPYLPRATQGVFGDGI